MSIKKFNRKRKKRFAISWYRSAKKKFKKDLRRAIKQEIGSPVTAGSLKEKLLPIACQLYDRTFGQVFLKREMRDIKVRRDPKDANRFIVTGLPPELMGWDKPSPT